MRIAMAFLTGLVLLWTSLASAGTATLGEGPTENADYVLIPCESADSSPDVIRVAQAEAPILLAQAAQCAQDKDGKCAPEGAFCGAKSNQGQCMTTTNKNTGKSNCQCVRKKQ